MFDCSSVDTVHLLMGQLPMGYAGYDQCLP